MKASDSAFGWLVACVVVGSAPTGCLDGSEALSKIPKATSATGGSGGEATGTGGTGGAGGAGGGAVGGAGGGGKGGSGGGSGNPDGGSVTKMDAGPSTGMHMGRFKVLVLSKTLEFRHDSIPTGQQMLKELGATADAMLPMGATKGSQFDVVLAKDDLSDFTDANLKNYELLFWMNPTGTVFSSGGANGVVAMAAIQKFMENGGGWGGVHSASDFEKTSKWNWFHDNMDGAFFDHHDGDGTPGTVVTQQAGLAHPIMRGVQRTWNTQDEWYFMSREIETLTGYTVLAKLAVDQRAVVWTHEMPAGGGRSFYTIRGHNQTVYAEADFRRLVHQGILWATHRMQ